MIWQPVSACGPACRPADRTHHAARAVPRMLALAAVLTAALVVVPVLRGTGIRLVARWVLAVLGVRVVRRGPDRRSGRAGLLVANHVSWLDVVVLLADGPARLVAKSEVRRWPLVGALAAAGGAIFLDRGRPRTLPGTVAEVTAALRAGRPVAVFPEGTTFCGARRGRFRPAMFQAAADAGAPVIPVTIRYATPAAAFLGADTLLGSVWRVAGTGALTVTLSTAAVLRPEPGAGRAALARAAQLSIAA